MQPMIQPDEQALKTAFALELLKNGGNAYDAAFKAVPDTGLACQVAIRWPDDTFVKAEKIRLLNELGPKTFLASKEDQAKEVYKLATDDRLDVDERLKAHQLYAQIMGHIERPDQSTKVNIVNQQVMLVKDHGDDAEWELKAKEQQGRLIYGNVESSATTN